MGDLNLTPRRGRWWRLIHYQRDGGALWHEPTRRCTRNDWHMTRECRLWRWHIIGIPRRELAACRAELGAMVVEG